jgi:hypothetical protein
MLPFYKTDNGRYILLPAFYAREWALRLDKAALLIFVVILFTLGHVLVAVCYALAGDDLSPKSFLLYARLTNVIVSTYIGAGNCYFHHCSAFFQYCTTSGPHAITFGVPLR